ncbi:hypothetical protein TNCV_1662741 [Trichonephila clavipes]|nr:hypothetical protein TNCV_1662741 [Trichonephila clavipes]
MPPNTLRVHTEYVLVKSVGPKVLWVVTAETTSAGGWRIFLFPPVPCLNCGGGDKRAFAAWGDSKQPSSRKSSREVEESNWGGTELNRSVICMVIKATANDRRTSSPFSL